MRHGIILFMLIVTGCAQCADAEPGAGWEVAECRNCAIDVDSGRQPDLVATEPDVDVDAPDQPCADCTPPPRRALAAGGDHTCVVRDEGDLWCWGSNSHAQLGRPADEMPHRPAPVDIASPVELVTAGESHTCAVLEGRPWCWGRGAGGFVEGNPAPSDPDPVDIPGVTGVTAIAAAASHTCALVDGGRAVCWGATVFDDVDTPTEPRVIEGIADAVGITGGMLHHCAWTEDGLVQCWGANPAGQLGTPDTTVKDATPIDIPPVRHVASEFMHTCAATLEGEVWCWGGWSQLEIDGEPVQLEGVEDAVRVAAGQEYTCALREDGRVSCWGRPELLGAGTLTATGPAEVLGIDDATDIVGGRDHVCVRRSDDRIACWGHNDLGQLGDDEPRFAAIEPALEEPPDDLAVGQRHACAVLSGALWCWGSNEHGQLGNASALDRLTPAPATEANAVIGAATSVTVGHGTTCVLNEAANVYCFGRNDHGQLGDGTTSPATEPVAVPLPGPARQVESSIHHSCARTDDEVICWGYSSYFMPDDTEITAPQVIDLPGGVTNIAVGGYHACATDTEGSLWCWGHDGHGVLGGGDANPGPGVKRVDVTDPVQTIALGRIHTCALTETGFVDCWGNNSHGQLGDPSGSSTRDPHRVPTLSDIVELAAGDYFNCARTSAGDWSCWGSHVQSPGLFDDPEARTYYEPVSRPDLTGLREVEGSMHGLCGLRDGAAECWGGNYYGQFGTGSSIGWRLFAADVDLP